MNVLLDTHALIWFITDDDKLSASAAETIKNTSNTCLVSMASLWEMGIKTSLGKLDLGTDLDHIFQLIDQSGFTILQITRRHIIANTTLEYYHRDPFDRLIIAQAKIEGFKIITKDREFEKYDVDIVW